MCIYTKQIMFPKELITAVEFLNTITIQIAEGHEDGRVTVSYTHLTLPTSR